MSLFRSKTETESGGFFPNNSFSSFNNNNSIIGIFFLGTYLLTHAILLTSGDSLENSLNSRHQLVLINSPRSNLITVFFLSSLQIPDKKSVGTSPPPLMTLESVCSYDTPTPSSPSSPSQEEIPVRETKASIARKRKISEMNPRDPVHCHYQRNRENRAEEDSDSHSHIDV